MLTIRCIRVILVRRRQKIQTRSCEQVGAIKKRKGFRAQFWAHQSCPLSTSPLSKDRELCICFSQQQVSTSDHKISKQPIDHLDMWATLTF